jgi:hypothetical protein
MTYLLGFNRVIDWRDSQSCWYFRPALGTIATLTYSLVSSHPLSTRTQWGEYGVYGVIGGDEDSDRQTNCWKVPLQVNFFTYRHLALLSVSLIFLRVRRSRQWTYNNLPATVLGAGSRYIDLMQFIHGIYHTGDVWSPQKKFWDDTYGDAFSWPNTVSKGWECLL